jgi:hypothetical protein
LTSKLALSEAQNLSAKHNKRNSMMTQEEIDEMNELKRSVKFLKGEKEVGDFISNNIVTLLHYLLIMYMTGVRETFILLFTTTLSLD